MAAGKIVPRRASAAAANGAAGAQRMLIVEDDLLLAAGLSRALANEGYDVRVAGNGEAALEALGAERHDVLLLDIGLPGIDGFEVLRRLRAAGVGSGLGLAIVREIALAHGMQLRIGEGESGRGGQVALVFGEGVK